MKKYYNTLNKEQKLEVKALYNKKYSNSDLETRFKRLRIYALVSLIFAIVILVYTFMYEESKLGSIIMAVTLIILAIVYLVGTIIIKQNVLNKVALENKKKK